MEAEVENIEDLDTPIDRANIKIVPIPLLDRWLEEIRERRLVLARKVQEAEAVRAATMRRDAADKFDKEMARVVALQDKIDQMFATYEARVNKLRVLEVEMS